MKSLLKLIDATLLDSSECHLHYCDVRHNVISFLGDTQLNEFLINSGTFKIDYFLPKLLENYDNCMIHIQRRNGLVKKKKVTI